MRDILSKRQGPKWGLLNFISPWIFYWQVFEWVYTARRSGRKWVNLVFGNLWRFPDISRLWQKRCCFGSLQRVGEPILTVRWDTVGMLKSFWRQAVLIAGLSGLTVMLRPLQPAGRGSHDSETVCSLSMVILWPEAASCCQWHWPGRWSLVWPWSLVHAIGRTCSRV
jgi:hypothetical protein